MSGSSLTEQDTKLSPSPLPQLETSGVLDNVTHLEGELPAWAIRILRNVSGDDGAGAGAGGCLRARGELRGSGTQDSHPQAPPALPRHCGSQESQLILS